MSAALDGITVLDLTRTLAGPFCTMQLADMGAEVVKIEEPTRGDETRYWSPSWNGTSCFFLAVNRNKRDITVNLKSPEGIAIVRKLAASADVLVESFRTGTADKMGIGYAAIQAINPRIVYCSISGYGRTGPLKDHPGYDLMVQAYGGLMSTTGSPDGPPLRIGYSLVDLTCGWLAYASIMTALYQRERTGEGQHLEASLLEGLFAASSYHPVNYLATGRVPAPMGQSHQALVPYQMFHSKDGQVMVGVANDGLWQRFCSATNRSDLLDDPRFKTNLLRVEHREVLVPIIEELMRQKTSQEWLAVLVEEGVPCSPINNIPTLLEDPQVRFREMMVKIPHPDVPDLEVPASPLRLSKSPATVRRYPPRHGEHTDEVLESLGYEPDEITILRENGTV